MGNGSNEVTFEESLKSLSLEGIILIQGLLAQRALELLSQKQSPMKEAILKPERRVLL